ncbi:MAG: hypothetical protein CMH57_07510 [Myxococcales bacterium]|nr:hypothetical protein [Myxococcales bacterium]
MYQFTPGRRIFALTKIRDKAREEDWGALVELASEAIEHDQKALHLHRRWQTLKVKAKKTTHPQPESDQRGTREIDADLDSTLGGWHQALQGLLRSSRLPAELRVSAQTLKDELFPSGVKAITQQPYIDAIASVKSIVAQANDQLPDGVPLKSHVDRLGYGHFIQAIDALSDELDAVIKADSPDPDVVYKDVTSANSVGQELMLEVMAEIIAQTRKEQARRGRFLAPILDQNQAIAELHMARHTVVDVNPTTGEPEEDEA